MAKFFVTSIILSTLLTLNISCECDYVKRVKGMKIEGIIKEKNRLKWNHNEPQLNFTNHTGSENSGLFLSTDKSKFWDFVNIGDSISKEENSFEIKVYRDNQFIKKFILQYGDCPEI